MEEENKERVTITMTAKTKQAVYEMAEEYERSFSQMTEILVREGLMRYNSKVSKNV